MRQPLALTIGIVALTAAPPIASAWDYEVHRLVNELALDSLPTNFPAFVRQQENVERIAFLSGEADRWRNTPDTPLNHVNKPDHYIDFEDLDLYEMDGQHLPSLRYDFIAQLAVKRADNPEPWAHLNEKNNRDHTKELIGLLPWTISEYYSQLKSGFSYLKAYEQGGGTADEIVNAQDNIIHVMGVMGHFVGDATQPLHTTKHFNGWVGVNPNDYTTSRGFHSWIDGGFWKKTGLPDASEFQSQLRPARPVRMNDQTAPPERMFEAVVLFILEQHKLVEPLYQLDKESALTVGSDAEEQGREFLKTQLVVGGQMLGDLWVSAWQQAPPDSYLLRKLAERQEKPEPSQL